MKAGTSTGWVRLSVYETANATNIVNLWVDMATGALGSTSVGGTGVSGGGTTTTLLNGWYRISLSFTIAATALTMMTRSAAADSSTTRVSGADRYQWGAQVNQGSVAAAYRKTTATATESGANQNLVTYSEGAPVSVSTQLPVMWQMQEQASLAMRHLCSLVIILYYGFYINLTHLKLEQRTH
jgi:hypothetical protein